MLVSGGKILALGKVFGNESLAGSGTPDHPLGVNTEWLQEYITSAAGDTTPYSGVSPITIERHKVSFNSAGFASQQWVEGKNYVQSAWTDNRYAKKTDIPDLEPYAKKADVEQEYAKKTDLSPYALTSAVNQKFNETSSWANSAFQPKGDYATKTEVEQALADKLDKDEFDAWSANAFNDYAKTEDVNEQFSATSAWALATFHQPSGNYVTSAELETYKTQVADEFENTSAWAERTFQPSGDYVSATDFTKLTEDVSTLSADFTDYKAEVEHKFEETSSWAEDTFQLKGNYVSAEPFNTWADGIDDALDTINDNFKSISADLETISADLEKKLDTEDFEAWQEGKDFTSYSAGEGIEVNNHLISLASSALDNYYTKAETWSSAAISTEFSSTSAWANETFQPKGNYASADDLTDLAEDLLELERNVADEFDNTSAWANETFQPIGDYITSADADDKYLPKSWTSGKDVQAYSGDGRYIDVTNHKISLTFAPHSVDIISTDESVSISASPDVEHNLITYDLSVPPPATEVKISGENGVSAEYDEEEKTWLVGLTDYREKASWGQVTSDYTTYVSGSEKIIDLNAPTIVGDDIAISTGGDITLGEGLYHIDAQIDINVPAENITASYYDVLFTIGNRSTIHELDASYAHVETVNLSFDIKVGASASPIAMYIAQLPVGAQYKVRNFNIHEVVTIDALIEGGLQDTYDAGVGIQKYIDPTTGNPTFSAKIGLGLSADANGFFNVACGSGLKIDAQGGVMAVTLDEVTEEVVNTVTELKGDLDTKVTVNFDYSNIDDSYSFEGIGSTTGQGVLLGYLFAVPINAKVYTDDDAASEYETLIGVYSKQQYTQNYVMFGLYEYDPSYPQWNPTHTEISGYGRTVPLCDTGAVKLKAGFNEFPVKHVNNKGETSPELKSSCLYYATLYVSKNPGGGIMLAGCPGYKTTFNTIPQITLDQANVNYDLNTMSPEERAAWSYNDMGWGSWGGTENYHELPSAPRFFMQVRNKKKDTTV